MASVLPLVPRVNGLLSLISDDERACFLESSEPVSLSFNEILVEPGDVLQQVYFPADSFISIITSIDGRPSLEVGLIGNEGMLGASLLLGVDSSPTHALVQGAGMALCMDAEIFRRQIKDYPALHRALLRYIHVTIQQLAQTAACTRFHVVEARLARWLLMTQDRACANTFDVTQEFLAYMLGVRRVGITAAASDLQRRKLISYSRGHMEILDRVGLEAASCSCYAADWESYNRTMQYPDAEQ